MPVENYPLAILFLTCNSMRVWETAKERRRWGVSCFRAEFAWFNNDWEKDRTFHLKEYRHVKFAVLALLYSPSLSLALRKKFCRAYFFNTHLHLPLSLFFSLNNDYLNNESDKTPNNKEREPDCCTGGFRGVSFNRVCTRL